MSQAPWFRAFAAVAVAAFCVTAYDAATGKYGGAGVSLPDVGVLTSGSSGPRWRLMGGAAAKPGTPASPEADGAVRFDAGGSRPRVLLSPDDRYLLGVQRIYLGDDPREDRPYLWRTDDGAPLPVVARRNTEGGLVAGFTDDGRAVIAGMRYDRAQPAVAPAVELTDVLTGEILQSLPAARLPGMPDPLCTPALDAHARVFACVDGFGRAAAWDLQQGALLSTWDLQLGPRKEPIFGVYTAISADGSTLAFFRPNDYDDLAALPLTVWNTATGALAGRLSTGTTPIQGFQLMPDGKQLVSVLKDGTVWLTTVATAESQRIARLTPEAFVGTDKDVRASYTLDLSRGGESLVVSYNGYYREGATDVVLPDVIPILRVDLRTRQETRYDMAAPPPRADAAAKPGEIVISSGRGLSQVAVPGASPWIVTVWGNTFLRVKPRP